MKSNKLQIAGFVFLALCLLTWWLSSWQKGTESYLEQKARKVQQYLESQNDQWEALLQESVFFSLSTDTTDLDNTQAKALQGYLETFEDLPFNAGWYQNDTLVGWLNAHSPLPATVSSSETEKFFLWRQDAGFFLARRDTLRLSQDEYILLALFPVYFRFEYENPNLQSGFPSQLQLSKHLSFSTQATPYPIHFQELLAPIGFLQNQGLKLPPLQFLLKALLLLATLIALGVFLHLLAEKLNAYRPWLGAIFLVGSIVALRYISIEIGFFEQFDQIPLFARSFETTVIHQSLGDLLINSILLLWIMLVIHREYPLAPSTDLRSRVALALASLNYLGINLGVLVNIAAIKNLMQRSNIAFDFDNLLNLNYINFLAFAALALLLLAFFLFSYRMMRAIFNLGLGVLSRMAALCLSLLAAIPLILWMDLPVFPVLLAILIITLPLDAFVDTNAPSLTWLMAWLIVFSAFTSFHFFTYQGEIDREKQLQLAQWLATGRDTLAERQLFSLSEKMDSGGEKQTLQEALQAYPYLDQQYSIGEQPAGWDVGEQPAGVTVLMGDRNDTLWYQPAGSSLFEYYWKAPVSGKVFCFQKKPAQGLTVLNELQASSPFSESAPLSKYAYAVYRGDQLISQGYPPVYPEESTLQWQPKPGETLQGEHPSELLVGGHSGRWVRIQHKGGGLYKLFNLFSFLFTLYSLLAIFFGLLNRWTKVLPEGLDFTVSSRPSLSNQIQLGVFVLIILSFTIIGLLTVVYFRQTSNFNQELAVKEKIEAIQKTAETLALRSEPDWESLSATLSDMHQTDLLIYDQRGLALPGTPNDLHRLGLLPSLMNPIALHEITQKKRAIDREPMQIGRIQFSIAYVPLPRTGPPQLFLGIPFFTQSKKLKEQVANFISTLLNLYVFLLLLAGSVALIAANSITRPLTDLGDRLRQLKLGKNEPLAWKRKDELGVLIQEYNLMLQKLENSTAKLAEAERDSAWKTMARQVAHEIKNPLTPIKLKIQHLNRAYERDPENIKKYIQSATRDVLHQVEILRKIASEFHTFAKMPDPENHLFTLNDLVRSVKDLYHEQAPEMDFVWEAPSEPFTVFADQSHLTRVFNNLYKNAIESIPAEHPGKIRTTLLEKAGKVIIEIRDNGTGIPPDKQKEVFVPNFTTKSSGTGLGLAISKEIVEKAKGSIYFKTEEGVGTSFFVELPLAEPEAEKGRPEASPAE